MVLAMQFGLILLIWQIGEWISLTFHLVVPGSIVGMLLLLFLLQTGILKEKYIRDAGDMFLKIISFFFIPSGVAILAHRDLIANIWIYMLIALIVSVVLVMLVSGRVTQFLIDVKGESHDV